MSRTIFYSWQSDLPSSHNRGFISDVLKKVIKVVNSSETYEIDLNLDRDTDGENGSPDIVNTIFDKIKASELFVADLSIINPSFEGRKTPNPNVLIELGYAAATIGWENIICFFNEEYGAIQELPFDIQHRRILTYKVGQGTEKAEIRNNIVAIFLDVLSDTGVQKLTRRRQIQKYFINESDQSYKLAVHQPNGWEFKLLYNMFSLKMEEIENRLYDIDNDIYYQPMRYLDDKGLFDWNRMKISDCQNLVKSIIKLYTEKLGEALAPPGVNSDEFKLLRVTNNLIARLNDCIDWEIDVRAIAHPEELEEQYKIVAQSFRPALAEFARFPGLLRNVFTEAEPPGGHNLLLTLELYPGVEEAFQEIMEYFERKLI